MTAIGIEMSVDTDLAAVAVASTGEDECCQVEIVFYGPSELAAAEVAGQAAGTPLGCGVYADPMPSAGLLPALRGAGVQLHLLEAVDVAAAAYEFKAAVQGRRVTAAPHEALRAAMQYAVRRPLAAAYAFERRKVEADMSALNAAAFALWGLRPGQGAFFAGWR